VLRFGNEDCDEAEPTTAKPIAAATKPGDERTQLTRTSEMT